MRKIVLKDDCESWTVDLCPACRNSIGDELKMIDQLKNCPNCAGILNEAGRCTYCGSKVYDFLSINFSEREMPSEKTYIRIKSNGKIILAPIRVNNAEITVKSNNLYADSFDGSYILRCTPTTEIDLNLLVTGEMIQIDEEAENEQVR